MQIIAWGFRQPLTSEMNHYLKSLFVIIWIIIRHSLKIQCHMAWQRYTAIGTNARRYCMLTRSHPQSAVLWFPEASFRILATHWLLQEILLVTLLFWDGFSNYQATQGGTGEEGSFDFLTTEIILLIVVSIWLHLFFCVTILHQQTL